MKLKDIAEWKYRGFKEYWFDENEDYHNPDGPAIITKNEISWYIHGIRHNDNGPAKIEKRTMGGEVITYMQNGELHREDGPAQIGTTPNAHCERWSNHYQTHRENGPAFTSWFDNDRSQIREQTWMILGEYKPQEKWYSMIEYQRNGKVLNRYAKLGPVGHGGFLHREDGPALETYWENGNIRRTAYYNNSHLHRTTGPAHIDYDESGKPDGLAWYLDGKELGEYTIYNHVFSLDMEPPEGFKEAASKYPKWGD